MRSMRDSSVSTIPGGGLWRRPWALTLALAIAGALALASGCHSNDDMGSVKTFYQPASLTADAAGAAHVDANLLNPWGMAYGPGTAIWVADNHAGVATQYDGDGNPMPAVPLVVTIPPPAGSPGGTLAAPTGMVFNGSAGFMGDTFIFATEDGTISGWSAGTSATLRVDHSTLGAVYKGLAIGSSGSATYIYATNFVAGTIEVFDGNYAPATLGAGAFTDPALPANFYPFGIATFGSKVYVTYAERLGTDTDETAGAGLGYVSVFNTDGTFVQRLASQGPLNAPWGLAMAPSSFGPFAGALLVGNFGDGRITAYDPSSGMKLGQLADASGTALTIDGLWGLAFGNGAQAGVASVLYFTAGPQNETHGLFGRIVMVQQTSGGGGGTGGGGY